MATDHRGNPIHAGKRTYDSLEDFGHVADHISMEGFDYRNYRNHENELLTPRLTEAGFSDIKFRPGESDSFGPLIRLVRMTNKEGKRGEAYYG